MQTVGVIGLGLMGKPMASNLLKAGFAVTVFNRSRPAMDALAAEGAKLAASPAEVGRASDVVVTMVPDSPDVEAVLLGPDGVCSGARPGTLLIDMSTIAPAAVRRIHETVAAEGLPHARRAGQRRRRRRQGRHAVDHGRRRRPRTSSARGRSSRRWARPSRCAGRPAPASW